MAAEKRVNYTPELTASIVNRYTAGESVEDIAESIGKAVRSVRSKLVREGVYIAPEKPVKAAVEKSPTKKELLNELESLVDFDVTGLMGATKEVISALILAFTPEEVAEAEAVAEEEEVEAE